MTSAFAPRRSTVWEFAKFICGVTDPGGTQGVRRLASMSRVSFICHAVSQRIYRVCEAVCHTCVGSLKMSRAGQLPPDTNQPVTACDGTMHLIERVTECQLCIVGRSCVYLLQAICIAAARPHTVCCSDLPVSHFGCPSASSDPVLVRM